MDWDAVQAIGVIVTLAFLGYQMRLQSQALKGDSKLREFELYQSLLNQHTELLKMADQDPALNLIWEPLDPERKRELDAAQASRDWGAWSIMTPDEQRGYRYIRYAIELFEQAHKVNQYGMLDKEIWRKWVSWMEIWPRTRYFTYMWQDNARKFMPSFVDAYWDLVRESGEMDRRARIDRAHLTDPLHDDDVLDNSSMAEQDVPEQTAELVAPESPAVEAVRPERQES
ncbi:hypothetical protein AB0K52_18780 [Glycomyces sp. NPDC049804]|uniref:hypothetical protein n=1 Tax=Glycomyces sp. NPDC049804 TaxID=3154363 RepID=UPI00343772C2